MTTATSSNHCHCVNVWPPLSDYSNELRLGTSEFPVAVTGRIGMSIKTVWICMLLICCQQLAAATITVNTADNTILADDGYCTLTEAVLAANTNTASGTTAGECVAGEAWPVQDQIIFQLSIFPAHFFIFDTLELNEPVKIEGPGAAVMKLTNLAETRVFNIQNFQVDVEFDISGITLLDNILRAATGDYGGAMLVTLSAGSSLLLENMVFFNNGSERGGGAIGLFGGQDNSITIQNSTFQENYAGNFAAGNVLGGGAIFVGTSQNVVIENSSFFNNNTFHVPLAQPQSDAAGGAILIRSGQGFTSTVDIFQSTFSNNSTTGVGGAIALGGPGFPADNSELSIRHSTVVLNEADQNDDETAVPGGGGVWSSSSEAVQVYNSIVAQNVDNADSPAPDLHGSTDSFGFNLIGNNSTVSGVFPAGQPNANDDLVGSSVTPLDPALAALDNYGGPTQVHEPLLNSPVLDQGKCASRITDQRLFQNIQTGLRTIDIITFSNASDGCDIGAVERFGASSDPVPEANDDSYLAFEDQPLVIPAVDGLLFNDVDDDPLIVIDLSLADQTRKRLQGQVTAGADGAFVFEPSSPDSVGPAEFVYTISDTLNTDSAELLIQIVPVNDPPVFNAGSKVITAIAGEQTIVEDWAIQISSGPPDEQIQSVEFTITPVNVPGGYFTGIPSLDISGSSADLSFELASDAVGNAVVSVVLQDNGGTSNGGLNQSDEVIVTIQSDSDLIFSDSFEIVQNRNNSTSIY